MYAILASRDVDCCLIPESPFYLEGPGGLFEYIERQLKENGHMVIVIAEGTAGQELLSESMTLKDASGNKLLKDVGLWISQKIKDYFSKEKKVPINLKYIDPTYMIRAIPSNAMAGYTDFTSGLVNDRQTYIPFNRIIEKQNKVVITDRINQLSFWNPKVAIGDEGSGEEVTELSDKGICGEEATHFN